MTLTRLVSNVRVFQEFLRDTLRDSATLPQKKGQTGFALDEAWWLELGDRDLSLNRIMLRKLLTVVAERSQGVVLVRRS